MKQQADRHRREVHFEVGEKVYMKLRPYRKKTLAQRRNEKLSPRYYEPYEIESRIDDVTYHLKLPPYTSIHPVFHVSQLKKAIGDSTPATLTLPPTWPKDKEASLEPAHLEGVRMNHQGEKELLITWKDLPEHDSTWELYESVRTQFSSFNLEDKVDV